MLKGSWTFLPLGVAVTLLHVLAITALLVTGEWPSGGPPLIHTINPLFVQVGGFERPLFALTAFTGFTRTHAVFEGVNLLAYAGIQWIGGGLLLDLIKNRGT